MVLVRCFLKTFDQETFCEYSVCELTMQAHVKDRIYRVTAEFDEAQFGDTHRPDFGVAGTEEEGHVGQSGKRISG